MARDGTGLPPIFDRPGAQLFEGDAADHVAVSDAVRGARMIVQIAPGRGSSDDSESSMLAWASALVEACVGSGVERLVYAGSIDSLDLGDSLATITGATPTDPRARERGADVWAKARSEELLLSCAREKSLSLCILRAGIVLGVGGTPFHRGVGNWRGETHCIGLSDGRNPLPLVLASDVATAIRLALDCEVAVGKSYNLVGAVRLSAREYVAELREALERPLAFHPVHPMQRYCVRACKWLLKSTLRRARPPFPSYRVVRSLGCFSAFDCSDVEADLGWKPVADRAEFIDQGLLVHGRARS
jgi:nucleoside-diphosphate-sugar epimerase